MLCERDMYRMHVKGEKVGKKASSNRYAKRWGGLLYTNAWDALLKCVSGYDGIEKKMKKMTWCVDEREKVNNEWVHLWDEW